MYTKDLLLDLLKRNTYLPLNKCLTSFRSRIDKFLRVLTDFKGIDDINLVYYIKVAKLLIKEDVCLYNIVSYYKLVRLVLELNNTVNLSAKRYTLRLSFAARRGSTNTPFIRPSCFGDD